MPACVPPWFPEAGTTDGAGRCFAGSRRPGRDVLGVAGIAVVLVRVVGVPAFRRAEVELEALPVAGRDDALEILPAVLDRLLANAAFLPHAANYPAWRSRSSSRAGSGRFSPRSIRCAISVIAAFMATPTPSFRPCCVA